jgi:hypothetical protein
MLRPLPEMALAGERELKKIEIGKLRGADHHTSSPLQRVGGDAPYLCLTVSKIETTLAREVGDTVLSENTPYMSSPFLQIASAE